MARKFKIRIDNTKPGYGAAEKTISYKGTSETKLISGIIKNVFNEVGNPDYSTLPGVDPNGISLRAITYSTKDPLMFRYEYITDYDTAYDSTSEEDDVSSILGSNFYYEQDREDKAKRKRQVLRFEKKSRPYVTYDEEYFQHIFNWPTQHTMKPRKLGAFLHEIECCGGTEKVFTHEATYPGASMSLDKVKSELYYIDDKWGYVPLALNSDGTIADSTGNITDKIGEPVIYHGGTDDNCIFFHYVVDLEDIDAVSTDNLVVVGDTVNGVEITNVVNYVVDVALKRTVSRHPKKGREEVDVPLQRFIDLGYTQQDYENTKSWLKLTTADGIGKGDTVTGKGIRENTIVTAVDEARNRVYISETLSNKKVKLVRFLDNTINSVNKNTLCYATISGGTFSADQNYAVTRNGQSTGITICVRAGKGIINRSAIVGTYFSKNKKEIEYEPIFYTEDGNCQKDYYEDENGLYVLGTVIWDDNTRLSGKYLLQEPKSPLAYKIASIYGSFTYTLIDKDTLESFVSQFANNNSYIQLYNSINAYAISNLGGKKAAATIDDICRDDLQLSYTLAYDPITELSEIQDQITSISDGVSEECITIGPKEEQKILTIDEVNDRFKEIVSNSIKNSTVMTKDYYDRLIRNEDSLINRINKGTSTIKKSVPEKTKSDNSPPIIEGTDDSGVRWISKNFRDLPPEMDRVKFFINDVLVATDKDLDPTLDLDPQTTTNQPKIIVRSRPCWDWNGSMSWSNTVTHSGVCMPSAFTSTIHVTVSNGADGYLDTITSSLGAITPAGTLICEGDPPPPPCTCTREWVAPGPKNADKNIVFGEKKEPWDFSKVSSQQETYIAATNWGVHPSLRDLENKDISDNSDILNPDVAVYPKLLWAPNINYQMDFHKIFSFRMEELSELLGETITNGGNPYLDSPIRSKLTKTVGPSDTTINVQSTAGFLSSGYLIIPKYTKKLFTTETGNVESYFTYCGEEIIYYKSKTSTTFENCERELFGTTSDFEVTLPAYSMEVGVRYKIESLGTTNWEAVGAGPNAQVGTAFVATKEGDGSGTVQIFGSGSDITASENLEVYDDPAKIPFISSYETGFSVSQHWVFRIKED